MEYRKNICELYEILPHLDREYESFIREYENGTDDLKYFEVNVC